MSAAKKERFVKVLWNLLLVCTQNNLTLARAAWKYLSQHRRIIQILDWGEAENFVVGQQKQKFLDFCQQSHVDRKHKWSGHKLTQANITRTLKK